MGMDKLAPRLTDIYIKAMLLVFPLWTGFEGYAAITRWKWLFYAAATALWCAALIYALARERERPRPDPLLAALAAALALWGALSLALSPWDVPVTGWYCDGLLMTLFYTLTALGVSAFGTMRLRYVNLLGVSVLLCCAVAWLQLFGLNPLWLYPEGMDYYGSGVQYTGAFLGTIGNTNMLGGFLAIAAPPVPGGSLTCYTVLLTQLGIPAEAVGLAVAGNVILDFFMTSCGISCLQAELMLSADKLGMLDRERLKKE